jgi:hypothetical protein
MRSHTLRMAASVAAAVIGFGSVASAQQQQTTSDRNSDQPQQQLEQTKRQEKAEMRQQGDRKIEVREMALWSLGDLPPHLMHKAMEKLADDPAEARKAVMQAANILELQASLAIQKADAQAAQQQSNRTSPSGDERISSRNDSTSGQGGQGQSSSSSKGVGAYQAMTGGDWSNTRDQGLWRAAEDLRELAMRIEYKQALTKDDLREPFARASLAMASFYQRAAQSGLQRQDEEQTGYTLKGAAEYFSAAHTFCQMRPTPEASRAMFDGERLAKQIVQLSKPTTVQKDQKNEASRNARGEGDLNDARTAAARQADAKSLPQEAGQVIANLGDAIRQAEAKHGTTGTGSGKLRDQRNDQDSRQESQQERR